MRHNPTIVAACQDLVTLASCAGKLGRGPQTLVRWSDAGPKYVRSAKRKYVFATDFNAWLRDRGRPAASHLSRPSERLIGRCALVRDNLFLIAR